jgi:hypothetical protein
MKYTVEFIPRLAWSCLKVITVKKFNKLTTLNRKMFKTKSLNGFSFILLNNKGIVDYSLINMHIY